MNTVPKESLDEPHIQPILERLGKLEAQNRRLKYAGVATLIAFGGLAVISQTTFKWHTIRAEEFQLVNSHGKLMGRMRADGSNPELELYNQHGMSAVSLYAYDNGNTGQLLLSSVDSGESMKTSANSVVITAQDGKVLWRAPTTRTAPSNFSK